MDLRQPAIDFPFWSLGGQLRDGANAVKATSVSAAAAVTALAESNRLVQDISRQVASGASEISSSIRSLGIAIGDELYSIRWQLESLTEEASQLVTLTRDRQNNEGRQCYDVAIHCYLVAEYTKAEEWFEKSLTFDPTLYLSYQHLGLISLKRGLNEDAIEKLASAVRFAPADHLKEISLLLLAKAYSSSGEYAQALEASRKAYHLI